MLADKTLDIDALRRRYAEERDRRLQVEDRAKYTLLEGELAERYDSDPWAETDGSREPISRDFQVIIVGGGFAGLLAAGSLRKHGIQPDELCIIERGADFGGTWYWNRYPGLSCDTEAYCYLPLLEETGYVPRQKYAMGPEILEHSQRIGRHFGLYKQALFQTRIVDAAWDEGARKWTIKTDRGDTLTTRFFWLCGGATNRPKLPGIPGLELFKGHSFHTMRWDYGYTGGGPEGNLTGLADKRVGLIGTGATAIQAVAPVGASAKEFYVFQRTPSAVNVRANRFTDMDWAKTLKPGWQMERMENFLNIVSGEPQKVDLVDDAWTWNFKHVRRVFEADKSRLVAKEVTERADFERMEYIRNRCDEVVKDPATANALKAWYGLLCKRPTFHDEYLETFNRPNVHLIDTQGRGVERFTETGVIANGREYELDCIIFATGFDTSSGMMAGLGFNPRGVNGELLSERWTREFSTLHGMEVSSFPNMFIIGGAQGTLATTVTYGFGIQTEHCAKIVEYCRDHQVDRVEVKPEAERAWAAEMRDKAVDHAEYYGNCTPGYINFEGRGGHVWEYFYGAGPVEYRKVIDRWMSNGFEKDLDLRKAGVDV